MNILSKKLLIIPLMSMTLYGENLQDILNLTLQNNKNIKASKIIEDAKQSTLNSAKNIYNPTLNIGANINRLDGDVSSKQVGTTAVGFIKLGINLYDGGKSKAFKQQKVYELNSAKNSTKYLTKQLLLNSVTLFFEIKSIESKIKSYEEKSKTLDAQLKKEQTKFDIAMSTEDNLLKLKSEYETNNYNIMELKYQKASLLQNLNLIVGKNIKTLDKAKLPELNKVEFKLSQNIKAKENLINSQNENIEIAKSIKKPQIKIENSYNIYFYNDYNDQILSDLPDQQNQLMLSISFNIFDTSSKSKIQSALFAKKSMQVQLDYQKEQELMNFRLSKKRLQIIKSKIKSIKSALKMSNKVFDIIEQKYQNGIVDNIVYLDALSKRTNNEALLAGAYYEYEITKANYYFSSGIDFNKVLKD